MSIWHPRRFRVLVDFDGRWSVVNRYDFEIASGFLSPDIAWRWVASQVQAA